MIKLSVRRTTKYTQTAQHNNITIIYKHTILFLTNNQQFVRNRNIKKICHPARRSANCVNNAISQFFLRLSNRNFSESHGKKGKEPPNAYPLDKEEFTPRRGLWQVPYF